MPHLAPVPLAEVQEDDIRERFEHYKKTRGFTPNSIMTMVRRPNIVRAFMALNQAVLYEGTVPGRNQDAGQPGQQLRGRMPVLPVAHGQSVEHLQGVRREDRGAVEFREKRSVQRCRARRHPAGAEGGRASPTRPTQADFDELKKHYDEGQIVEIVAAIALFGYLNRWNDTMATALEPLAPGGRARDRRCRLGSGQARRVNEVAGFQPGSRSTRGLSGLAGFPL